MSADPRPATGNLVPPALVFYGLLAGAAWIWRVEVSGESIWQFPVTGPQPGLLPGVAVGLAVAGLYIAVSGAFLERTRWGRVMAREMAVQLRGLGFGGALLLAAVSGLAEELFFRGALQPRVGLVAASLLFGALHVPHRREFLPWPFFAGAVGFVLGALYEWSGSLLGPVLAHIAINVVGLFRLVRQNRARAPAGDGPSAPQREH